MGVYPPSKGGGFNTATASKSEYRQIPLFQSTSIRLISAGSGPVNAASSPHSLLYRYNMCT